MWERGGRVEAVERGWVQVIGRRNMWWKEDS